MKHSRHCGAHVEVQTRGVSPRAHACILVCSLSLLRTYARYTDCLQAWAADLGASAAVPRRTAYHPCVMRITSVLAPSVLAAVAAESPVAPMGAAAVPAPATATASASSAVVLKASPAVPQTLTPLIPLNSAHLPGADPKSDCSASLASAHRVALWSSLVVHFLHLILYCAT